MATKIRHKLFRQLRDILSSLAQWRYGQGENVQTMEEILTKSLLKNIFFQIVMGGDNNPEIG